MISTDVAVIGAGPAGAIAATCLARHGLDVLLIDPGPRDGPVIGETLPVVAAESLARHELPGPLCDPRHSPISGTISAWDGPPVAEAALDRPGGKDWRLDRRAFDDALVQAAVAAGAHRIEGIARSVQKEGAGWRMSVAGETLTAAQLVDASGRRGLVGRSLGLARDRQDAQIAVWAAGLPLPAPWTTKTLIQACDGGWWYGAVLPSGQPIAAYHCSVARAQAIRREPQDWHTLLEGSGIIAAHLPPSAFTHAALQFTDASGNASVKTAGPGWVACGDAAISFDPIAAQGLLNAVRTGLAAAGVLTGGDDARHRYRRELQEVWSQYKSRHQMLRARLKSSRLEN